MLRCHALIVIADSIDSAISRPWVQFVQRQLVSALERRTQGLFTQGLFLGRQRTAASDPKRWQLCIIAIGPHVLVEVLDIVIEIFAEHRPILRNEILNAVFFASSKIRSRIGPASCYPRVEACHGVHERGAHFPSTDIGDLFICQVDVRVRAPVKHLVRFGIHL
jgi:hypothetical protein